MQKNMGSVDRIVRIVLALVFAALIFTGTVSGVWAIILGILAVIFVATSFLSFCPLYLPFKLSTLKK
ncbi:MAG: DUF2892 domain-containing protein [Anaerolineae bacterium]